MVREYQVDVDPARLRAFIFPWARSTPPFRIPTCPSAARSSWITPPSTSFAVRVAEGRLRLENVVITSAKGVPLFLKNVAVVQMGPAFRRSALEKNGREAVGGVVTMRDGENPLQVTQAIKEKIRDRQDAAVVAYEQLIGWLGKLKKAETELQEMAAMALLNQGYALGDQGRNREEVKAYDKLTRRFSEAKEPGLQVQVAQALYNKGIALIALDEAPSAAEAFREVVERFELSRNHALRELVDNARTSLFDLTDPRESPE